MWYSFVEVIQQEKNEIVAQVTTDGRSPWFAGHFPDNPILPGIAQLKMVADIIGASRKDGLRITGLSRVKFRKIVRPGDLLDIHAGPGKLKDQYAFRITSSNEEVCSGMMFLETVMPSQIL